MTDTQNLFDNPKYNLTPRQQKAVNEVNPVISFWLEKQLRTLNRWEEDNQGFENGSQVEGIG